MILYQQFGIATPAGGGANDPVSVAVPVLYGDGTSANDYSGLSVPVPPPSPVGPLARVASYTVIVNPSQAAFVVVSDKSPSGFTVTLTPPAGATLAAGTFDVTVIG